MAEGAAVTHSYVWALPLLCVILVAMAAELPIVGVVGVGLFARVMTDDLSAATSRHSASTNLSGVIAALLILIAFGLLLKRQRGVWPVVLASAWLAAGVWVAINLHGLSTLTLREGVREASIVAVAAIVWNAAGKLRMPAAIRLVQLAGVISAVLAVFQLVTHTGQSIGGEMRANGTFAQANSAAVYFALGTVTSLWRYLEAGRSKADLAFLALYACAAVATFSLGGLGALIVMLLTYGLLRPGSRRVKVRACTTAVLVVGGFLATPIGAERVSSEFGSSGPGQARSTTSLAWRFHKWDTLLPEWERHIFTGTGLGSTTDTEGTVQDHTASFLPHSEIVRYLVETGTVGVLVLVAAIVAILRRLARQRRLLGSSAAVLGVAVLLGLIVNSVAANTLLYTPAAYAAALVVAAAVDWRSASPVMGGRIPRGGRK